MKYIPERRTKKAMMYILCLFIIGVVFVALSVNSNNFKWIYQFAWLVCLVLFIQSVTRYFIYEYSYVINQDSFEIIQKSGKKQISLCNINFSTAVDVYTKAQYKLSKKNIGRIKTCYNYTQNFMPDNKFYYIFDFNGEKFCIVIEINGEFAGEMKAKIKKSS